MKQVPLLINGDMVASTTEQFINVTNPANGEVIAKTPVTTDDEMQRALQAAKSAFETWRHVPVTERARIMMRYQAILKREQKRIATVLAEETGKVFDDAMGDVWRGIEVVEQAMNAPSLMMGET
ncbi:MAG: aldehyde dehydrogenase family protein, partial [Aestuariibacter sp.]|nr:aldehyde dehydrogenase family protein [Aestuariibacter sp.]